MSFFLIEFPAIMNHWSEDVISEKNYVIAIPNNMSESLH